MKKYSIEELKKILTKYEIAGNENNISISNVMPIDEADMFSIVWVKSSRTDRDELIRKTKAKVIVCDNSINIPADLKKKNVLS